MRPAVYTYKHLTNAVMHLPPNIAHHEQQHSERITITPCVHMRNVSLKKMLTKLFTNTLGLVAMVNTPTYQYVLLLVSNRIKLQTQSLKWLAPTFF